MAALLRLRLRRPLPSFVACQNSDNIVVFALDDVAGSLTPAGGTIRNTNTTPRQMQFSLRIVF